MPIFQPRNRVQILREATARVIARSKLVGIEPDAVIYHLLAAMANEDAEQYLQMARLRSLFSIDSASGSDLDARAAEILPARVSRRGALAATVSLTVSRTGTVGTLSVPAGSLFAATDDEGDIKFRTTAPATILAGNTSVDVSAVATIRGERTNVAAGEVVKIVTRIAGIVSVTNASAATGGQDRESDESFRARLKAWVQAISRGTPTAIEAFAKNVILRNGQRVIFASLREPIVPTGSVDLFIDDGTGNIETTDATYLSSPDTLVSPAVGGEQNLFTTARPIKDDGTFALYINAVLQTRGTDYELNASLGQVELDSTAYPTGLTAGDVVTAEYRYYTGLIQETQRIIDGDPTDPLRAPGVRPAGVQVIVQAPTVIPQSFTGQVSALDGFDPAEVLSDVEAAIQGYINTLDIGEDVIVSEIVERAMGVTGMYDFRIDDLTGSGSGGANQIILENQVARITSGNITLT